MEDQQVPVRIILAGLSATGKSTHSRLLAAHYGIPYVSMRSVMAAVLRARELPGGSGGDWTPAVDAARGLDEEVDREADRRMLERIEHGPGVFDSWALPWLYQGPAVRVWIAADLPSRVQRCRVSAITRGLSPPERPAALLEAKDEFSRVRFKRLYGFDLAPSPEVFDVIAENSELLPEEEAGRFEADIERFHRDLVARIEGVAAVSMER